MLETLFQREKGEGEMKKNVNGLWNFLKDS